MCVSCFPICGAYLFLEDAKSVIPLLILIEVAIPLHTIYVQMGTTFDIGCRAIVVQQLVLLYDMCAIVLRQL